jgi:hypothetical protein
MAAQVQAHSLPARSSLLRRAMRADGIFSTAGGVACVVAAGWLAAQLGVTSLAIYALGAALLGYAAFLFAATAREPINRRAAIAAIVLNVDWVIASAVILAAGWLPLTTAGFWIAAVVALAVADFAVVQYVGLRRQR